MEESDLYQKNFHFVSGKVNVYSISVAANRDSIPIYKKSLSIDEKEKASRFKFKIDQERYIISRGVLRILSSIFLKLDASQIQFTYNEFGKPYYKLSSKLNFNLSHSGDIIMIAFAEDVELGIDVELVKTDFDPLKLAQNFFSKSEIDSLKKQSKEELVRAFYRCWTRKEAFIKAEGSGLSFPLNKFSVSIDSDSSSELLKTDWDLDEKNNWLLFSFIPKPQYLGALAVRKKNIEAIYFDW